MKMCKMRNLKSGKGKDVGLRFLFRRKLLLIQRGFLRRIRELILIKRSIRLSFSRKANPGLK